jgi:predicted NBD/HSP70 family sugar kinase
MPYTLARTRTLSTVIRAIRDSSPISRSALALQTEFTHAAISRAVSALLTEGTVVERRLADTTGPRRKHGLELNGDFGYALGIEYSATHLRGVVVDLAGQRRLAVVEDTDLGARSREERINLITDFSARLLETARSTPGRCLGVGLVDPGIVDRERGVTLSSSLLDDWSEVPIAQAVLSRCGLPVRLVGSGIAKVKAVDRLELARPVRDLLYVEYGDGIACGLKLDGRYIAGSRNSSGELGHLKISTREPKPCRCGGLGCLEAHAALPAIVRRCQEALSANSRSVLSGTAAINGPQVLEAAAQHDLLARFVVEEAFEMVGVAIAGVVSIINPGVLVLDGTFAAAGDEIRDHLLRVIRRSSLPDHWSALEIQFSKSDEYIGSVGGAVDLIDSLLEY